MRLTSAWERSPDRNAKTSDLMTAGTSQRMHAGEPSCDTENRQGHYRNDNDMSGTMKKQRLSFTSDDEDDDDSYETNDMSTDVSESGGRNQRPSIRGIKKQSRYVPGVPMTKEELSAWRKEARRVRNRESAAASRKRTRDRIEELEGQVKILESKYSAALKTIVELEAARNKNSNHHQEAFTPTCLKQDLVHLGICSSPLMSRRRKVMDSPPHVSPTMPPTSTPRILTPQRMMKPMMFPSTGYDQNTSQTRIIANCRQFGQQHHPHQSQHMDMISRPIVC